MQDKEFHRSFGRGRNVSCMNFNCINYNKKIGRSRSGWYARKVVCQLCHNEGYVHNYNCTVGNNNTMECKCHINSSTI